MAENNDELSTADIERRQATLEKQQQRIGSRRQQLIRRRKQLRDPGLREPGETRQLGQEQQRREQLSEQISSLREAEQEIETQQQTLKEAKTKEIGGIELPRSRDVETFAAQVGGTLEGDDDTVAEALAQKGAVNIDPDQRLTAEQRRTAEDLIEFAEQRREAREEEQESEQLQEILEDQPEGVEASAAVRVDGRDIPITEETAEQIREQDIEATLVAPTQESMILPGETEREVIAANVEEVAGPGTIKGVTTSGEIITDEETGVAVDIQEVRAAADTLEQQRSERAEQLEEAGFDPFRRNVQETPIPQPIFDNPVTQSQLRQGNVFQPVGTFTEQTTGVERITEGLSTAAFKTAQGLSDLDVVVEQQIGRALPGPNPFEEPRDVREQQRTVAEIGVAGEQVGTGVQEALPVFETFENIAEFQRKGVDQVLPENVEEAEGVTRSRQQIGRQFSQTTLSVGEQSEMLLGEAGEGVSIFGSLPGITATAATETQRRGVERGTELITRSVSGGLATIGETFRERPQQLQTEVLAEAGGLLFGSPVNPTVTGPSVGTVISRGADTVSEGFVRETVQDIEETPAVRRQPARQIQSVPGGFTLSQTAQEPVVPQPIEDRGGIETSIAQAPEAVPPQIRRIRTRELPLLPESLTRRDISEDVFFEEGGAGPLVRERTVRQRPPSRDELLEFLQPKQRRKGTLQPQQTVTPDQGQIREQFSGQDFRQVPEPQTTTVDTAPQQLVAPTIQGLQTTPGQAASLLPRPGQTTEVASGQQTGVVPGTAATPRVSPVETTTPQTQLQTDTQTQARLQTQVDPITRITPQVPTQVTQPQTPVTAVDFEPDESVADTPVRGLDGDLEEEFRASLAGIELGIEQEEAPDVATGLGIRGLTNR